MRIGFYAEYTEDTAQFAHDVGFKSLQLSAWHGSTLDAETITTAQIDSILSNLSRKDIEISALGYYPNYLDTDPNERERAQRYFPKVMQLAEKLGVGVVATFVGRNPDTTVEENIPDFKELFSRYCDQAHKLNVKIAIENCPMISAKTHKVHNIAFSPEVWEVMFETVDSEQLGLEFDPSHLVWLGIDYLQALKDFGHKVFHVHAKDMEIDRRILQRSGILGRSFGPKLGPDRRWWRARAPGWGEVDWPKFITEVIRTGYRGNIDIENEDDIFAELSTYADIRSEADVVSKYSRDRHGLRLGYETLSKLITQ
jgi:sugar phosphate isomerase/epimerase